MPNTPHTPHTRRYDKRTEIKSARPNRRNETKKKPRGLFLSSFVRSLTACSTADTAHCQANSTPNCHCQDPSNPRSRIINIFIYYACTTGLYYVFGNIHVLQVNDKMKTSVGRQ